MTTTSAQQVVHTWMNAINSRQLDTVLALYADDAVLLPTFSPRALHTQASRKQYFEQLAARPGLSVSLHDKTLRIQSLPGGSEIASGIYRFNLEIDGEPLVFEARFSFIVDPTSPKPVRHHHSSQIPRTLS